MIDGSRHTVTRSATEDELVRAVLSAVASASGTDAVAVETALNRSLDPDALDRLFRSDEGKTTLLFRLVDCEVSVSSDGRVVATRVRAP